MPTMTEPSLTTQVYRVYIKATPEAIWDAITKPEWSERYGYRVPNEIDLRPGGAYRGLATEAMKKASAAMGYEMPDVVVDGEVIEADPPRKLVQTWRMLMEPSLAAEGFTRLTWEIEAGKGGVTRVTVIHDLQGAPQLAAVVSGAMEDQGGGAGGGWIWVLSGMKTLLETGMPLDDADPSNRG